MHTPSRSPSNSGHNDNAGEDEINMDFDFDVPQSPFHDDADDARLGGDGSASTPMSSQGQTSSSSHSNRGDEVRPPVMTKTYHPDINGMLLIMKFHIFI
jgi:hypothetical protein